MRVGAGAECCVIGLGVSVAVNGGCESLLKTKPLTHNGELGEREWPCWLLELPG